MRNEIANASGEVQQAPQETVVLNRSFWAKFEKIIDSKLDAKFDANFKPLEQKFDKVEQRLDKVEQMLSKVDATTRRIDDWTNRQDSCIESEITMAIGEHLKKIMFGFDRVMNPVRFPKTIRDINNRDDLTEFDGIAIVSDDIEYCRSLRDRNLSTHVGLADGKTAYLIVVEAKQHLTSKKLTKKLRQVKQISKLLRIYKERPELMPESLSFVSFDRLEPIVGLYVGGQEIDASVYDAVKRVKNLHRDADSVIDGILEGLAQTTAYFYEMDEQASKKKEKQANQRKQDEQEPNNYMDLIFDGGSGGDRQNAQSNNVRAKMLQRQGLVYEPEQPSDRLFGVVSLTGGRFGVSDTHASGFGESAPQPFAFGRGGGGRSSLTSSSSRKR